MLPSLAQINKIMKDDIEVVSRITNNIDKKYLYAFIRVSKIAKLIAIQGQLKKDLKNLYITKRSLTSIKYSKHTENIERIKVMVRDYIKALTIISYIKRGDWARVGICAECFGSGRVNSDDMFGRLGTQNCDCSYGLIHGWELSDDLIDKDYKYNLMNTSVVLELFNKEYKGLHIN